MKNRRKTMTITLIIVGVIVVLCAAAGIVAASILHKDTIYNGVFIDDLNVAGMTKSEVADKISEHFTEGLDYPILLRHENIEKEINLSDLMAGMDVEATIQNAYEIGRSGSTTNRLKKIFDLKKNNVVITPLIQCDEVLLETYFKEIADQFNHTGHEMQLELKDQQLIITRGVSGSYIDISGAIQEFKESAFLLRNGVFTLETTEIHPAEPDAKDIHDKISGDPIDASYKIENQRLVITEDKPGVSFDIDAVQAVIDQTPGETITVPVTIIPANLTAEQLQAELFPDRLATYTTRYNAGDVSRSYNVSLASQKINDVVLAPGEVFSYNDTVGPRTVARGFKIANVYVGNKVEPGVGGGICQVSSTLFNAVVLADLEIVFRTNHSLPVTYVPLGRDATVSYGSIDFKFKNNTNHPIKIVASASGGSNQVSVYGIKENKNKSIEITTECTGTYVNRLVQKEDPNLPVGTVKVEQAGSMGSSYNAYKVTKENGTVVKTELLTKSTYVSADRIEIIGTMPAPEDEMLKEEATPETEEPQNPPVSIPVIAPNATGTDEPVQSPGDVPAQPEAPVMQ